MPDSVIYIHGLGDFFAPVRQFALATWRLRYGVRTYFVDMDWSNEAEPLDTKLARINDCVAQIPPAHTIRIIGESAGGAVAIGLIRAYPDRLVQISTVAGKNFNAQSMSRYFIDTYPALFTAVSRADILVPTLTPAERERITNLYSRNDKLVTPENSVIDGARNLEFSTPIHQLVVMNLILFHSKQVLAGTPTHR